MEKHTSTTEGAGFTKINLGFMDAESWLKRWRKEIMGSFSRISHILFGYRHDPGRSGAPLHSVAPVLEMVVVKPTIRKPRPGGFNLDEQV